MSKKIMLLALVAVSAAAFALPAGASAAELHASNAPFTFAGTFGPGTLTAKEEPVITCGQLGANPETLNHVTGTVSTGGTTGTIHLDFTGCHTSVFGFTAKCRTVGSALDNTITTTGAFHFITWKNASGTAFPAVLVTPEPTEIVCAGISKVKVAGNLIGTVTSPACGAAATKTMKLQFNAVSNVQEHKTYTGLTYNLTAQTEGGEPKEAGLNSETATVESSVATSLTCT